MLFAGISSSPLSVFHFPSLSPSLLLSVKLLALECYWVSYSLTTK